MKVFISWSGALSHEVARLLSDWLPNVLQDVEPWLSSADIDKGSVWFGQIRDKLAETAIGILCLSRENLAAPWVLFEAGALSKGLTTSRVCPLLVDILPRDLQPPLSEFNATLPIPEDMLKLLKTINAQKGEGKLTEERLQRSFSQWWGGFETDFKKVLSARSTAPLPKPRTTDEMVLEVLDLARSIHRTLQVRHDRHFSDGLHVSAVSESEHDNFLRSAAVDALLSTQNGKARELIDAALQDAAPQHPFGLV